MVVFIINTFTFIYLLVFASEKMGRTKTMTEVIRQPSEHRFAADGSSCFMSHVIVSAQSSGNTRFTAFISSARFKHIVLCFLNPPVTNFPHNQFGAVL